MAERISVDATVVSSREVGGGGSADDGESQWWEDLGSAVWGSTTWDLAVDIPGPDGRPYRAQVRTKQPNRLFGVRGFVGGTLSPSPGLVLPVLVDLVDPTEVEVDWKAFADRPGAREQLQAAEDAHMAARSTATFAELLREDPSRLEQSRKVVHQGAQSIVEEVRAGRVDRSVLQQYLATNVPPGLITPQEADAYWRVADPG